MVAAGFRLEFAWVLGLVCILSHCAPIHDATPANCPTGQEPSGASCVCVLTQAAPIDGQCPLANKPSCKVEDCVDDGNPCTQPTCLERADTCGNEPVAAPASCEVDGAAGSCVSGTCVVESPQWELGTPFRISGDPHEIVGPQVALAANGDGIAMWGEGYALTVSYFDPEGGWSEPVVVEEDAYPRRAFSLGTDSLGNAIFVYQRVEATSIDTRAVRFDSSTRLWGHSEVISRDGAIANSSLVRVSSEGDVWAVWTETPGDILLRRTRTTALGWETPIVALSDGAPKRSPRATLGDNGAGAVAFYGNDAANQANSLWVAAIDPEGSVGTAVRVDPNVGNVSLATIASNEDGELMAVWEQVDDIWFAHFVNEQWEPPALIEASTDAACCSALEADGAGNFLAAWGQGRNMRARRFSREAQQWEDIEVLSGDDNYTAIRPSVKAAPNGEAWLVWLEGPVIRMSHFTPETRWSYPENLSPSLEDTDPPIALPRLSRAADGTLAVVWADGGYVWAWVDRP
ncbi:MAG: hypothetical protein WCF10_11835 [Polyangiales bacterium]